MPRRRRSNLAHDLISILAHLPWWACLIVALVAYAFLHSIAGRSLPPVTISGHAVDAIPGALLGAALRALAVAGQFLVPLLAVVAAILSYAGRRRRRGLFLQATDGGSSAAAIDAMSWQDFELLIAEAFRLQGFAVVEKGGAGADGGVDLELVKDGERWLVQAKHWRALQVPVEVVRELAGVMPYRRAVGGYVVTSGRFTGPAEAFAKGRGIKLVNGPRLDALLREARNSLDGRRDGFVAPTEPPARPVPAPSLVPNCPNCREPMILRTARKGANAGSSFWGCVDYPACRGTRAA